MSDLPLVLLSHTLPPHWITRLAGRCRLLMGPPAALESGLSEPLRAALPEAEGLLSLLTVPVNAALLDAAPQLRVVSNMAVGYDNIDVGACTARGVPVGHTPGVLAEGTADLTMAILLSMARRLPEAARDAAEGRWTTWSPTGWLGMDLHGATFGIVGMGQIGTAVARRAHAFGVRLVYHSRSPHPDVEQAYGAVRLPLSELLERSDFVCLHTALNEETHHLIGAAALRRMKPSALLVNVARGAVVDTDALVQALTEGWIRGAALDVTDPEPLPPGHPLYRLPNALIVPHIGSATEMTRQRMAERACDNLLAGLGNARLPYCVNPAVYDAAS